VRIETPKNGKLTDLAVRGYAPGPGLRVFTDPQTESLYLVIAPKPSGTKSFMMRFRRPSGRMAKIVLGRYDASGHEMKDDPVIGQPLSLRAARLLAAIIHRDRRLGIDVIADHKARRRRQRVEAAEKDAGAFAAAVRDYIDERVRQGDMRGWRDAARLLGLQYPKDGGEPAVIRDSLCERWANKAVREIDRHLIKAVVDEAKRVGVPGIKASNKGRSDNRARLLIVALSSMFSWLQGEDRVEVNPVKTVSAPAPSKKRDRVLTDDEIRIFWKACGEVGEPYGSALKILLLTGARREEVVAMTRGELSDDGVWTLSGDRTKNKLPHKVPLSTAARSIIDALPRIEGRAGYVFTTSGRAPVSAGSQNKDRLDAVMLKIAREEYGKDGVAPFVTHDLRRTFVTGAIEIGLATNVIELCVNHVSGHKAGVAGVYNRSEMWPERKTAMERWSAHVAGLVAGEPAKVVPFSKGRGRGR
jgi:integrase